MVAIVYSIVVFMACLLGPIVGLGGGVFIRPIFDAFGFHYVSHIAFYSSTAILAMAIVSTAKKMKDGMAIEAKIAVLISLGAVVGGMFGDRVLHHLIYRMYAESSVQFVQVVVTITFMVLAIAATVKKGLRYEVKSNIARLLIGFALGTIATFLGIGGGPINVPILMILFGMPIKTATAYSVVIIFFSHFSRLITIGVVSGYSQFDLSLVPFLLISAAIGGLIGANLSRILSEKAVQRAFIGALLGVIAINAYNGIVIITG